MAGVHSSFFNCLHVIAQEYQQLLAENLELRKLVDTEEEQVPKPVYCEAVHGADDSESDANCDANVGNEGIEEKRVDAASKEEDVLADAQTLPRSSLDRANSHINWDALLGTQNQPRHPIFSHGQEIRAALANDYTAEFRYDVKNYYKTTGVCQKLARSPVFENVTMVVIVIYAIYMSIDMDLNDQDLITNQNGFFIIAEQVFCFFFVFELMIRFGAFQKKCNSLKDAWFVFDLALVLMMVAESWVMNIIILSLASAGDIGNTVGDASILRIFRLMRLTRLFRMARLIRMIPELLIMVKAIVSAARSVGFTLILMCICLYVFAIAFRAVLDGTDVGLQHFGTVPYSMHTLFVHGTLLDSLSEMFDLLMGENMIAFVLMYIFIFMSNLTVMNMLIGVLCEVITAVANAEKEAIQVSWTTEVLQRCLQAGADTNNDGAIDLDEFQHMIENPQVRRVLKEADVDAATLINFADVIFEGEGDELLTKIPFSDFMSRMLKLRGSNTATVKDLVDLRKWMHKELQTMRKVNSRMSMMQQGMGAPYECILHV